MRPSSTLSAGSIIVGVWMGFLTIINIAVGAYSNGRKVNWIDFITNGENTNSVHEIGLTIPDDFLFGLLSLLLIGVGVLGMGAAREDGFRGWLSGLPQDRILTSLYSTKNGMGRTMASWMILFGAGFYLIWSVMESTWVDPGVYSVMIFFVMIGMGLNWVQDANSED